MTRKKDSNGRNFKILLDINSKVMIKFLLLPLSRHAGRKAPGTLRTGYCDERIFNNFTCQRVQFFNLVDSHLIGDRQPDQTDLAPERANPNGEFDPGSG